MRGGGVGGGKRSLLWGKIDPLTDHVHELANSEVVRHEEPRERGRERSETRREI